MQTLYTIFASLAILIGGVGSLCLFVLCIAGSPNSSDAQLRLIKLLMLGCVVGGLVCFVGGIVLIVRAHPALGGIVGIAPMLTLVGLMIWLDVTR